MAAAAAENPAGPIGSSDSASTTSLAIPVARSGQPVEYAPAGRGQRAQPRSRTFVWLALVGALAIAFGGLVALAGLGGSAGGSPSRSAAPSPSPSRSAGPSPTPKPAADPFAPAQARLADLRDAIAAASGGHGIKGREANELQGLLVQEQGALDSHDAGGARATADQLVQTINNDIENDRIDKDQAQALVDAAQALHDAVAGL